MLKATKAFFTGRIPGECKSLRPNTSKFTSKSLKFTLALKSTCLCTYGNTKSWSATAKETKISPHIGVFGI